MKKSAGKLYTILFVLIAVADTIGIASGVNSIHAAMKPLLMPALLLLLIFTKAATNSKSIIIAGLLFSWLGDVLLLFENNGPLFFMGGLASFLITHICYIIYFLSIKAPQVSLIKKQPWLAALVAGYGVSLLMFLQPNLGDLRIPVTVYAVVICAMLVCSLHVFNKVNKPANYLFVTGALLFAASDSMLAVNKFYAPFAGAGVWIMISYCAAQFCIVQAVIKRTV